MKKISVIIYFLLLCTHAIPSNANDKIIGKKNYLHEYSSFNDDETINVVVEIPAGDNQKWEVSKVDGTIRREFSNNSFRTIKYLPYVANYGFIPQTLESKSNGGDGDPIDVILLGEKIDRGEVIKAKILGIMLMMDSGEIDNKVIAVPLNSKIFIPSNLENLDDLKKNYPGVLEILEIWFSNYKAPGQVEIRGYDKKSKAVKIIEASKKPYEILKGYWLESN